jgi:hypothetical protein
VGPEILRLSLLLGGRVAARPMSESSALEESKGGEKVAKELQVLLLIAGK